MSRSSTEQHNWLIGKLSSGKYTLDELEDAFRHDYDCYDNKDKKRSIQRWISDVQKLYNLLIVCDNKKYYIADKGNFKKYDTEKWVAYTSKINDLIIKHDDIKDKLLIDNIPSENQYLEEILNAISSNLAVTFSYKSYSDPNRRKPKITKRVFYPYCVKRFENRWYVIGFCVTRESEDKKVEEVNDMRTFSLDMMSELKVLNKKFKPDTNFDAAKYFEDVYGIITDDNDPLTEIRIRVDAWLANYLRTLPLHPSQKEVSESTSFNVFQYTLRPANDFYQALLHHGSHLKVLSPESVRNKMKELIQEMAEKYEND